MSKIIFMTYLPPVRPKIFPKSKNAQNLLKIDTCDTSNIPISILMLKNIFILFGPNQSQN